MRSRKEQLQAYQFLRRRIGAALLSGEPDTLDPPMRRVVRTSFAGIMVGIIVIAVFGIYGLLRPGGAQGWKADGSSLVIEKETGATYVYFEGQLHPMLNFASARLFVNKPDAEPFRVSRRSLEGTPRATRRGIPGAPHSLPDLRDLIVEPWTVCAEPEGPGASTVTLLAGEAPQGGDLADNEALVVTAGSYTYLVWRDHRYLVPDVRILSPFQLNQTPQEVGAAWVNALPEGPEIVYPEIPEVGSPGPTLPNGATTRVGELFVVNYTDHDQFVIVMPDGFAQIPQFAARVIQSDPDLQNMSNVRTPGTMAPGTFSQTRRVPPPGDLDDYPSGIDTAANADTAQRGVLCVSVTGTGGGELTQSVSAVARVPSRGTPVGGGEATAADNFYVRAGEGAVVAAVPHPDIPSQLEPNARFLITDRGVKFPLAGDVALKALGYGEADIARLPVSFLSMLPSGPSLNQRAASQPAASGPQQQPGGTQR